MKRSKSNNNLFSEAYMVYYPQIFSSVMGRVGNADDARDICQEVFTIFYEKFDTINNIRTWLYGTLKNVVYRYYSSKKQNVDIDELFDSIGLSFTNGFKETRILINEAIAQIECGEEERIMLDLIARHNFSYVNVAKVLGLTRRKVEYKYGQLIKEILDYLKKKGITDIAELL